MMKTYSFDKSLHERFIEYTEILSNPEKPISASHIESEWVCDTEIVIEPIGWQALWNVPYSVCAQNQVHYPLVLLVEVLSIDYSALSALVKITWDKTDRYRVFPAEYKVKLIELYPTIEQSNTALDIIGTAHCLDRLRFFYTYLWMPWDNEDDDNIDWVSEHLESRLKFAYEIRRGAIDKQTCDLIRSLVREARHIWKKISHLENLITDDEDKKFQTEDTTFKLMNLHFRLDQIKSEVGLLENPTLREMLLKHNAIENVKSKDEKVTCYFVWLDGTLEELRETCDKVQEILPDDISTRISGCLDEALHTCKAGDMFMLDKGKHMINGASGLETGGIIKGLFDAHHTILHPKDFNSSSTLLDFSCSSTEAVLENVSVSLGELPIGIIIRSGIVWIKYCVISNLPSEQKTVQTGIVVMPGATVIIENTRFESLGTAVFICANGKVVMNNCEIRTCYLGVQLSDDSSLTANKCVFNGCLEYTIQMDTERDISDEARHFKHYDLPNDIEEINLSECLCTHSDSKDVILKPKHVAAMAEWLGVNPKI